MIGPLIFLCTLDHFIQHQHTVVRLANRRGEGERQERVESKRGGREGENKKEEEEGVLYIRQAHSFEYRSVCNCKLAFVEKLYPADNLETTEMFKFMWRYIVS